MSGLPDPKDMLPPVPLPFQYGHVHDCPHCKSLWIDKEEWCVETYKAECPACFDMYQSRVFDEPFQERE